MTRKTFQLYTGALKAATQDDGVVIVRGTTSSTIRDLQGDVITLAALETMRQSALDNMTIWLNHDYTLPGSLFGSTVEAQIVKRTDPEEGECWDLDIAISVSPDDENPDAMKTARAILRGRKLGLSIGGTVTKHSIKTENGVQTFVIEGIELHEASVVGIPANQRSYLRNALKSLRASLIEGRQSGDTMRKTAEELEAEAADRLAQSLNTPPIEGEGDDEDVTPDTDFGAMLATATQEGPGPDEAHTLVPAGSTPAPATTPEPEVAEAEGPEEVVEVAAAAPAPDRVKRLERVTKYWDEYGYADPSCAEDAAADAASAAYIIASVVWLLSAEVEEAEQADLLRQALALLIQFLGAEAGEVVSEMEGLSASFVATTTKAIETAISGREKVAELTAQVTQLGQEKGEVEGALTQSLELLTAALAIPAGRKSRVAEVASRATDELYPWLAPAIRMRLDAVATQH